MPDTVTLEAGVADARVEAGHTAPCLQGGVLPFAAGSRFGVRPAPDLYRLALRGDPAALGTAYGIALPTAPCRSAVAEGRTALWLGPDEWLLLSLDRLDPADVPGGAVVDVSHRQVGLLLDGPGAADVLAAGCPLDLHPAAFPPGMCTRTVFGKAEIVLWRSEDGFHVEVWRSFAAYVGALIVEAGSSIP